MTISEQMVLVKIFTLDRFLFDESSSAKQAFSQYQRKLLKVQQNSEHIPVKEFFLKGCGLQPVAKKQTYSQILLRAWLKLSKLEQALEGCFCCQIKVIDIINAVLNKKQFSILISDSDLREIDLHETLKRIALIKQAVVVHGNLYFCHLFIKVGTKKEHR